MTDIVITQSLVPLRNDTLRLARNIRTLSFLISNDFVESMKIVLIGENGFLTTENGQDEYFPKQGCHLRDDFFRSVLSDYFK